MLRYVYNLILKGQENEQTKAICETGFKKVFADVEKELAKSWPSDNTNDEVGDNVGDQEDVFAEAPLKNPPNRRPKGVTNARLKGKSQCNLENRVKEIKKERQRKGGRPLETQDTGWENRIEPEPEPNPERRHILRRGRKRHRFTVVGSTVFAYDASLLTPSLRSSSAPPPPLCRRTPPPSALCYHSAFSLTLHPPPSVLPPPSFLDAVSPFAFSLRLTLPSVANPSSSAAKPLSNQ
ncbi:hypothetical protein RIF29_14950 [Crotalaria pallida]|uniref:Uncharacterized protein n=1 Tax=Crotalaria pallida TaxID=3830 RepID=A0AAN9FGE2_CROPI